MNWRLLLLPFSWIYGTGVRLRNVLYNIGVLKSTTPEVKTICVGNLSIGGTGKTPHVEFIANYLLEKSLAVAILSRGYGRQTKGYLEVSSTDSSSKVGDEPLQYKRKFMDDLSVHVCENRLEGIKRIVEEQNIDVVILDDAFQHRSIKAGLNIIVTPFDSPYSTDHLLPAGNLRESRTGAKRSDIVVVSKCPPSANSHKKDSLRKSLNRPANSIYFSSIDYKPIMQSQGKLDSTITNVLLVTGIGMPKILVEWLNKEYNVEHLSYPDHHQFSSKDIHIIEQKFDTFATDNKIILTTEKDYVRLDGFIDKNEPTSPWCYIPIEVVMDDEERFKKVLESYVGKNN